MLPQRQLRRQVLPVFTVEECSHCGLKSKRSFQQGDYVYKEGGECPQCHQKMLVTMIYGEAPKPS